MNDQQQDNMSVQPDGSPIGNPIVVIRRRGDFIFGWVASTFLFALLVLVVIWPPRDASFFYILQGMVAVWPALWVCWLVTAHPKLVVWQWGLDVTNWFFRYRIPWGAVRWVQASDKVVIHLADGRRVKPAVGAFSVFSAKRGSRMQSDVRERVEDARKAAAADHTTDTTVARRLDLFPVPFLGLFAGLALLAMLTSGVL